jgi:hypothetical protein
MEARAYALQQAYEAQVSANARKDEALQRTAQLLRAPLVQARAGLEPLVNGQIGSLTPQQADSVHGALDRLATLQRYVEELKPAEPAGQGSG